MMRRFFQEEQHRSLEGFHLDLRPKLKLDFYLSVSKTFSAQLLQPQLASQAAGLA